MCVCILVRISGIAFYASTGEGKEQRIDLDAEIMDLNDFFENTFFPSQSSFNQLMKRSLEGIDMTGSLLETFVRLSNDAKKGRSLDKLLNDKIEEQGYGVESRDTFEDNGIKYENINLYKRVPLYKPGGGEYRDTIKKEINEN